ncbi:TonB-dependent siderophore receptor [Thalassoporum mexicanum]|uniref:TonB-dependent siderophore receptor n=1 Tax=Thalassoporum mexicanum TaxID=3457544 RepID=UPI00031EB057|nr:TonB-dependent siderophore receptor [Pseudanabaena sp. PCC 7367]
MLETGTEAIVQPTTQIVDNALVADIPNAILVLEDGQEFEAIEPAAGIDAVLVYNLPDGQVRIEIIGLDAAPDVEIAIAEQGLLLSVLPGEAIDSDIELVVTAEPESRYAKTDVSTATRTDTPLRDIPQSIQVIPKEVLEDQQIIQLRDALRNVSGVQQSINDPRGTRFQIRGFDSASILRDGFRSTNGGNGNTIQELANIERIEVLKGPASVLSGALEPGGVINLVTEKPTVAPFYEIEALIGNRSFISPSLDISGPLTESGNIKYRLNTLYRNEDSFRDFNESIERYFFAPTISWQMGDRTDFNFSFEYLNDEAPADFGQPLINGQIPDAPRERIAGEPDDVINAEYRRLGYNFEHRFSDNWKIRNAFAYTRYDTAFISAFPFRSDPETGALLRSFISLDQPSSTYEVQTNVVGEFWTGSIAHKLLFGVDYYRREDLNGLGRGDITALTPFDFLNPVYGLPRPDFNNQPIFFNGDSITKGTGIYLQDQIEVLDNLKLLLGFRYENVDQTNISRPSLFSPEASETSQSDDAFSPRLGIVYQPIEPLSLYASFGRSFFPNTATTVDGSILEPERGRQYEVGARAELYDGRLIANIAYFNITKSNVATPDPDFPMFSIATGEQQSKGIELDVIGELLPGWDLIVNYAYTDAKITSDNTGLEGNRVFNVPEHSFNIWTTYEIQQGTLGGLSFGIGFNAVSDREANQANTGTAPGYFLTNAAIAYKRNNWRAAINFRNLFDVDYIESTEGRAQAEVNRGAGFTVIGSVSYEF